MAGIDLFGQKGMQHGAPGTRGQRLEITLKPFALLLFPLWDNLTPSYTLG